MYLFRFLKALLITSVITAVFSAALVASIYGIIYAHFDGTAALPADCGIVFGAAVYGQNLPGPAISRRIEAAAALYREGKIQRLIVSGGKGIGVRESEAQVMRTLAQQLGVEHSDIAVEDQSHSTWENIQYVRDLTRDCASVVGISDQYHLARIELLSWRQGWSALQTVPAIDRPPEESERKSVMREVLAYLYYVLYLDTVFPDLPAQMI